MRRTWVLVAALAAVVLVGSPAIAQQSTMPQDARVYILWPSDGQVIKGAFWVRMGLSGAGIAPAGVQKANTGHHHLIVDADLPPLDQPIPNDHNHLHFGLGQTEARLDLPPGRHTLQLLLGDEKSHSAQPAALFKAHHHHRRSVSIGRRDRMALIPLRMLGSRGLPRASSWRGPSRREPARHLPQPRRRPPHQHPLRQRHRVHQRRMMPMSTSVGRSTEQLYIPRTSKYGLAHATSAWRPPA